MCYFFFCQQKTAYEMRSSDWSSDVCSSDLHSRARGQFGQSLDRALGPAHGIMFERVPQAEQEQEERAFGPGTQSAGTGRRDEHQRVDFEARSEEHTSELQSLMRISYAVFCLKKKKTYTM